MQQEQFYAVDLFCGGGGLTCGLKQSGFCVVAGVELDKTAAATYSANNPNTIMFNCDIKNITGEDLLAASPNGKVDLIAACPPCQGFSSLTAKYKTNDKRNLLINEVVRLVKQVKPSVILIENVPGLANGRGNKIFQKAISELESVGYVLDYRICDVAEYGVPQHRKRLIVLGAVGEKINVPESTNGNERGKSPLKTVRETISGISVPTVFNAKKQANEKISSGWNVIRNISEITFRRLQAIPPEGDRRNLPEVLRPRCHRKKDNGFINVYGRMKWDSPAPTITGGCVTLSKGRFGHPDQMRTISVYEAALLQSFPKDYLFRARSIDEVCKIIGNAVPPYFARVMSDRCMKFLRVKNGK